MCGRVWSRYKVLAALFYVVVLCVGSPAPAFAQDLRISLGGGTVTRTTMRPGSTLTVNTNIEFADVVVGNPNVADVVPLSERSLYIQGNNVGFTNLSIYDGDRKLLGIIDVRVQLEFDDFNEDVAAAVRAAVPGAKVRVSNVGNRIRLSGVVANAVTQRQVIEVAQQFSTEPVINALAISDAQQVSLEVRVLEASRTVGRDLGVNVRAQAGSFLLGTGSRLRINADGDSASPTFGQAITFLTDDEGTNSQGIPFGTLVANVLSTSGLNIDLIIDALEKKGLARRLAQPNLTTISGETARFHAGGEVPIQQAVASGSGVATSIDYRPFGVRLEFVPTVLDNRKVNLRILTEVSEIDNTINVNGNPGFTSRKAETVIELRDGQSFAMAGLLQVVNQRDIEQLPWLSQLPVLGPLFRSTQYRKQETDLVIVVTPRLVRPANPGEDLYSPLDQTRPSNDIQLFALGLLEVDKDMIRKFRTGEGILGPYGHRINLEFGGGNAVKK